MKKSVISKIKALCNEEVKFVSYTNNSITLLLPYDNEDIEIDIEGNTDEEQIEDFVAQANKQLQSMIDHLEDCKLYNL